MSGRPTLGTFRWHLALTAAFVTAVFAFVAAATLFVPLFAHLDVPEFSQAEMGGIAAYVLHLHETFWPVVFGALVASVASGIVLFQRMRSPLVRFVAVYQQLAAGRIPKPLKLRAHDYLQDEAAALNRLLDAQRERNAALLRELERLHGALADIRPTERSAKSEAALAEADESVETLRRLLGEAQ